ncbi:PAS domain-containing protein [Halolamina sp. CBA1230]|uniref:histidine kinase N-terminal 7TM domain-containing protein n=1 Tax=Halolamina sp. CBA1230 TaxID=1853690 RepID=UPI0009A24251|nr:histidine kinase N-terminal 7TM domain-containing protein [Halolamina sp. CBA1230]QKY19120.1 PAS domain-containing protein [Halolamina sp. CBA1230]
MQFTAEVGLSAATALLTASVAAFLLARRDSKTSRSLVAFNLAVAIWTGGNALQLAATTLSAKLVWVNVQYVGIALLPVSIFAFAVALSGDDDRVSRTHLGLLAAPLVVLVLLSWTNAAHGLVRTSVDLAVVDGVVRLQRTFGPVFWLGWVYSNLLNLTATALVLRTVVYADRILERRVLALLIGPLVPWLAQLLYLMEASPIEPELFFSVTGVAFAYAVVTWDEIEPAQGRDAVLELLEEGVVVVGNDGRVVDLNSAARRLLGLGDDPAVGEPVDRVLDATPELLERFRADESAEDLVVDAGGTRRHLDVRFASFDAGIGRPDRVIVLVDVSALRERERALERQNDRLESFASIVSHDLRNPLNVAQGRVELARAEHDTEHLAIAQRAHERMATLIDDILTLAREGRSVETVEPVDIGDVSRAAWEVVETPGATLEVDTDREIRADNSRLRQLFENLFRNSVEHGSTGNRTPQASGDSVEHGSTGSRAEPDDSVEHGPTDSRTESDDPVDHNEPGVTVRVGGTADGFYVADDGKGIPESDRDRVFEAGYTTDDEGTGLGLNIVEEIVAAHGWSITVREGDDGGTRFDVNGVETAPGDDAEST